MQVYWEYAFAENCLLDGLLLYLAVRAARGRVRPLNLIVASAAGGGEALLFPLFALPVWGAYPVKFAGGILLVLLAVSKAKPKTYVAASAFFLLFTFALGGLLTAAYSFFNVEYAEGNGYYIESAPVALVLALAGIFTVTAAKGISLLYKSVKLQRGIASCTLECGGRQFHWKGLCDSGNLLSFRGDPVCVISPAGAFALFGRSPSLAGRITLKTVNGTRDAPVFVCDKLKIGSVTKENVYLAVGEVSGKHYQMILHTALMEECDGSSGIAQTTVTEDKG